MPAPDRDLLFELLSDTRIKGPQVGEIAARAIDPGYWRRLVPDLHIGDSASRLECVPVDDALGEAAVRDQNQVGYFRLPGVIAPAGVRRLNDAIDSVVAAGFPAAFVFVYDEAWQSGRSPAVNRVLDAVLGSGFLQIAHVWAHVVNPVAGATGWAPHVDGDPGGRMTVWMGLTESTLDNGCMHVVPRTATSLSPDLISRFRSSTAQFTRMEVASMLHATHALEASPGDALGWGFDVIHWGGYARRHGSERRGLSFEYIAADQQPGSFDASLIPMDALPPFETRMRVIAKSVAAYRRFEPALDRFSGVASEITARLS